MITSLSSSDTFNAAQDTAASAPAAKNSCFKMLAALGSSPDALIKRYVPLGAMISTPLGSHPMRSSSSAIRSFESIRVSNIFSGNMNT